MQLDAPSSTGGNMIDLLDFDAKPPVPIASQPSAGVNLIDDMIGVGSQVQKPQRPQFQPIMINT
jgi:hypothetical protein